MTSKKKLEKFANKVFIDDYYLTKSDFTHNTQEIIVEGLESFNSFVTNAKTAMVLYQMVRPELSDMYFIQNSRIESNRMCLCNNCSDLNSALHICITWSKKGYNTRSQAKKEYRQNFKLYRYNEKGILTTDYIGEGGDKDPVIFGYLLDGKPAYTALLKI